MFNTAENIIEERMMYNQNTKRVDANQKEATTILKKKKKTKKLGWNFLFSSTISVLQ